MSSDFTFLRIPYSEHYIAENFLGFEFLNSAFTADITRKEKIPGFYHQNSYT